MKAGSQCQNQRPSASRRFLRSPAVGQVGRDRVGGFLKGAEAFGGLGGHEVTDPAGTGGLQEWRDVDEHQAQGQFGEVPECGERGIPAQGSADQDRRSAEISHDTDHIIAEAVEAIAMVR